MITSESLHAIKGAVGFHAWAGTNRLTQDLLITHYAMAAAPFPQWRLHRWQPVSADDWSGARTLWTGPAGIRHLLRLDFYICRSRLLAHETLARVLGYSQSTALTRLVDLSIGDVVFTAPGQQGLAFARANVVVCVTRAAREPVPVPALAASLDEDLVREPVPAPAAAMAAADPAADAAPGARRFELRVARRDDTASHGAEDASGTPAVKVGAPVRLELDEPFVNMADAGARSADVDPGFSPQPDPRGEGAAATLSETRKIFVSDGEIAREGDGLIVRPDKAGACEIRAYARDRGGTMRRAALRLAVAPA